MTWSEIETAAPAARPPAAPTGRPTRPLRIARSRNPVVAALDGGGEILHRRGRDVMVGAALILVPVVGLNLWTASLAFARLDGDAPALPAFGRDEALSGIETTAPWLAVVFASLAAAIVGIFGAAILIGERFGDRVDLGRALRTTAGRLPAMLAAWAIGHVWVPIIAALIVTGADWGSVATRAALLAPLAGLGSALTLFVAPAMVAEHAGPMRALRRSFRLARLRMGSAFGFVAGSWLVGGLLLAGIAFLPRLVEALGFITFGGYTWLAEGVATQLGVILVVPLVALATAQMYLEVRLDAEGLDLHIDATSAFGAAGSP